MIKGTIYNFWPVQVDDDESFMASDTWHWRYLGWVFEFITFLRAMTAQIMGIDDLPFMIKIPDEENKSLEATKSTEDN